MHRVTLEELTDILEVMVIEQTIDSGFAPTHHGHVEGQSTIVIATCRADGGGMLVQ